MKKNDNSKSRYVDPDHMVTIGALRTRTFRSCTPAVARNVGISLHSIDLFLRGQVDPPQATLFTLAKRLGLT